MLSVSISPYKKLDRIINKNLEINKISENWLWVKIETIKYILSEKKSKYPFSFINSVSEYEISIEKLLDKEMLGQIGRDHQIYKEISQMMLMWQDIQFRLIKSIFYNNDIGIFVKDIFAFITETNDFDMSMKEMTYLFDIYLKRKVKINWILFIISVSLAMLLISIVINLSYSYIKVVEKEKEIRKISKSIMDVRDRERMRIYIDFHDIIVQNLLLVKRCFNDFFENSGKFVQTIEQQAGEVKAIIDKSIKSVREISFNLRPPEISKSLNESIQNYINEISIKTNIRINFYFLGFEGCTIDNEIEIIIYRLICEAVNNVLKHAEASVIVIRAILAFPNIVLKIEDNGIGFDLDKALFANEHMGLHGMNDRVKLADGIMDIKSVKNSGTVLTFKIPCRNFVKENEKKQNNDS
jgi:signal transduction histidine kinase